jgi:predicted dehydrogenase
MRRAVQVSGVRSVTSFVLRWNARIHKIRELVRCGAVGDVIYAECDYWHPLPSLYHDSWLFSKEGGGSAFLGAGCHAADALRYCVGEVAEVAAFSASPRILERLSYDSTAVATVAFEHGAVGKLSTVLEGHMPHLFNLQIIGTKGAIWNDRSWLEGAGAAGEDQVAVPGVAPDLPEGQHPFSAELAHFLDCIEAGVESHASLEDSARTMALCFAIDESIAHNGARTPVRVRHDSSGSG